MQINRQTIAYLHPGIGDELLKLGANDEAIKHGVGVAAVEIEPGHGRSAVDVQLLRHFVEAGHWWHILNV